MNTEIKVTIRVFDTVANQYVHNCRVNISLDAGEILSVTRDTQLASWTQDSGIVSTYGETDANGVIEVNLTRAAAGAVTLTAQVDNSCNAESTRVVFHNPGLPPVEIFFCIDSTSSMGDDQFGEHRATDSVAKFLNDMVAAGVTFSRLGGVKFNEGEGGTICTDQITVTQFRSLNAFTTVGAFISNWVKNGYATAGGDSDELQLDSLQLAAKDMKTYSDPANPHRYIVLITDNRYHEGGCGAHVSRSEVVDELVTSGCSVYISLFDLYLPDLTATYSGLNVSGGTIESAQYYAPLPDIYPLTALRQHIMGN